MTDGQSPSQKLEAWLRAAPGVYIHPALRFAYDDDNGTYWQAADAISEGQTLLTIPHSYALSYLNALVDDAFPVFRQKRDKFSVEAIGFFYLMLQYVHRKTSFWQPYLDSLPSPTDELTTPLWYGDEDKAWLINTDVAETMSKRELIYKQYFHTGCEELAASGVDASQLSWDLFRWSITMFTSRSFSSTAITPQESKYWTMYKTSSSGARQTVLLDLSNVESVDRDFSVLFPGMDTGNHDLRCEASWTFDPGRFKLALQQNIVAHTQIFNNYGPKPNHEFLQGYGFAIEDNPHDTVLLTLKAPSESLQAVMRPFYAGYFDAAGNWLSQKATFGLKLAKPDTANPETVFATLPNALLDLLVLIISYQLHIKLDIPVQGERNPRDTKWQRYLPHIARTLTQSLASKYSKLKSSTPIHEPANRKQKYAKHYRDGQVHILQSYLQGFNDYMQSLLWHGSEQRPVQLAKLEDVLSSLQKDSPEHAGEFLQGIAANARSSDVDELRTAGWEEDIWVLLLCYLRLLDADNPFCCWISCLTEEVDENASETEDAAPTEQLDSLLTIVQTAALAVPDSVWEDTRWTRDFIASIGARIFAHESFFVGSATGGASHEPRVAVLWFNRSR